MNGALAGEIEWMIGPFLTFPYVYAYQVQVIISSVALTFHHAQSLTIRKCTPFIYILIVFLG